MAAVHDFHAWVELRFRDYSGVIFRDGEDGPEAHPEQYVPYSLLQGYWTQDRINQVLLAYAELTQNILAKDISSEFLRIFSILVYIDKGQLSTYLDRFEKSKFTDSSLPLTDTNKTSNGVILFTNSSVDKDAFSEFQKQQFKFNHFHFTRMNHLQLDSKMILPFQFERWLARSRHGSTAVALCTVPTSAVMGKLNNIENPHKMVVKVYNKDEPAFASEKSAYTAFENHGTRDNLSPHSSSYDQYFLRYYGSLVHGSKGLLFVEYANQGSLDQFFNNNRPPHTFDELISFWESFNELFVGLHWLHTGGPGGRDLLDGLKTVRLNGVHQDVKPANIFVFRTDDKAKYSLRFKIGDLGSTSIRVTLPSARETDIFLENPSTKMYSAPELFNAHPDTAEGTTITREADIWSLGCVMAEAAVWSICGSDGVAEFFEARKQETMKEEERIAGDSSYFAAFHKHGRLLPNFDSVMTTMLGRKRVFDNVTEPVIDLVRERMLVECAKRKDRTTEGIRCELERKLEVAKKYREDSQSAAYAETGPRSSTTVLRSGHPLRLIYQQPAVTYPSHSVPGEPAQTLTSLHHTFHAVPPTIIPPESPPGLYRPDLPLWAPLQVLGPAPQELERGNAPRLTPQPVAPAPEPGPTTPLTPTTSSNASARRSSEKLPLDIITLSIKIKIGIPKRCLENEAARIIADRVRHNKQVFIIHDSVTMRSDYWDKVTSAFNGLTYLLEKGLDVKPDKIHLRLTSKPTKKFSRSPSDQRLTVGGIRPEHGGKTNETADGLATIIAEIGEQLTTVSRSGGHNVFRSVLSNTNGGSAVPKPVEGIDIYLLTDGVWNDDSPPSLPNLTPFAEKMGNLASMLLDAKISIRMILVRDDQLVKDLDLSGKLLNQSLGKAW
ncbi:hypothetical protein V8F20_007310 [Naviculisporaceae sp. PSN 640]